MRPLKLYGLVLLAIAAMGFASQQPKTTVFLIGDSTVAQKNAQQFPETGWGTPFQTFFNNSVAVVKNLAYGGESTKTYIANGYWEKAKAQLKSGDYLLIQFGHNDEVASKKSYTPESDFVSNLKMFLQTCKEKNVHPVLITSAARRIIDDAGIVKDSHAVYAGLVKKLAEEQSVPLIDLNQKTLALLAKLGKENSKALFNQLEANEHPNYPSGKIDNTHFSEYGARIMAQLVWVDLIKVCPDVRKLQAIANPRYQQK